MDSSRDRRFVWGASPIWLVTVLLFQTTGCFHFRTEIPGVLDLRSDAALAKPIEQPPIVDESLQREGAKETLQGQGVTFDGHRVLVHERVTWLGLTFLAPGTFLLWNGDGAVPELEAALGENGILRNVQLSHRLGFPDLALDIAMKFGQLFCPPLFVLAPIGPPMSMWASGERITPGPFPGLEGETELPPAAEADESAPAEQKVPEVEAPNDVPAAPPSPPPGKAAEEGPITL